MKRFWTALRRAWWAFRHPTLKVAMKEGMGLFTSNWPFDLALTYECCITYPKKEPSK